MGKDKKNYNSDGRSSEDRALDRFTDMLIEKIETLQGDWKKPWFSENSTQWPKNLNGREYNGMNSLLLMMHAEKEGYKLPVWATFDRVSSLNYTIGKEGRKPAVDKDGEKLPIVSINKGEKSFPVFITVFTVIDPETKEKIKYDDYKQMSKEEREKMKVYPKLQVYNVFNVAQTNLQEARPELWKKLEEANTPKRPEEVGDQYSFEPVDRMIKDNLWICPIKEIKGDNAYYSISKNEIVVPTRQQFINGESFYSNLFHEMGHSTGAENQLNRLKPGQTFGSAEYAREELVAELGAALVAQRYGMTKNIKEDSAAYLKSWLNSLHESPEFLKTTLFDVKRSTGMITQRIDKIALDIEQGIDTAKSESREEENQNLNSDLTNTKENKPEQEAVAAKEIPTEENIEEEYHFHRGR